MAASYPTSIKVFTTRVDGETIFAPHINDLQDEVAAVQSILGTAPQGGSSTVKDRIAAVETGKSDTSHNHDHSTLTGLTTGDPHTQYIAKSVGTAKGDLLAYTGSGVVARRAVGTNGFALLADSAQATGVNWVQLDHGTHLAGLADDDHPQYHNDARGDARYRAIGSTRTVRIPHTWHVPGEVKVASGDTDYILPFFVAEPAGQTVTISGARYRINSGTSATAKLALDGVDVTGLTALSATTTSTTTDPADVAVADGQALALVITAVSGTPMNLTFTVWLDYTF